MTTEVSPDGQATPNADPGQGQPTTPTAATPAAPQAPAAGQSPKAQPDDYGEYRGQPIRDFADAKRAIDRKVELESENRELRKQLDKVSADASAAVEKLAAQERDGRRREIVDTILEGVHTEHRDQLKLMLAGLHEAKDIDLYSDDPKTAGKAAREKLSRRFPHMYRAEEGTPQAGQPGAPRRSYGHVTAWTELTKEQQEQMSNEDFAAMVANGSFGGSVPNRARRR